MFDNANRDLIKSLINQRKEGTYITPLYVRSYNERYGISEINQITNFNPSGFKVGFGIHISMMDKFSFPKNLIQMFDPIEAFTVYNDDQQISEKFIIFESGDVDINDVVIEGKQYHVNTHDAMSVGDDDRILDRVSEITENKSYLTSADQDAIHQLSYYYNMLKDFLTQQQKSIRKKRIEEELNNNGGVTSSNE